MLGVEHVINRFRTPFHGKSSPVNFFWGGFDLNHTRFNGEPATPPRDADVIMEYSENEANFSIGFWPGSSTTPANFYAYITPAPGGIQNAQIQPDAARWEGTLGEFILPYDDVQVATDPEEAILCFFQSTYEACAKLAGWDRDALEGGVPKLRPARH